MQLPARQFPCWRWTLKLGIVVSREYYGGGSQEPPNQSQAILSLYRTFCWQWRMKPNNWQEASCQPNHFVCKWNTWALKRQGLHYMGMLMDITEDHLWAYFVEYGHIGNVSAILGKIGIATGDFVLQMKMTWKSFLDITTLTCWDNLHDHRRTVTSLLVL